MRRWVCYHCRTSPGFFDNPRVSLLTPLCVSERRFSVPAPTRLLIHPSGRHQTEQPCSLLLPRATGSCFSCMRSCAHAVVAWLSSLTPWKTKQRRRGRIYFPSCRQTEVTHPVHLLDSARGRRWALASISPALARTGYGMEPRRQHTDGKRRVKVPNVMKTPFPNYSIDQFL